MNLTEEAVNELYDVLHSIARSLSKISDMEEKEYGLMLRMSEQFAPCSLCGGEEQ